MIKPEFWDDEKLAVNTSLQARLVFIGMWNHSDDYGVVKGNVLWLKNKILPYDDSISFKMFSNWIEELKKIRCILPFEVEGEVFFHIRSFLEHQKVNRPSKQRNPAPPKGLTPHSLQPHGGLIDETETETEVKQKQKLNRNILFENFWILYDKSVNKKKCESKFNRLKKSDIDIIFKTLPGYVANTPDKQYRKAPLVYLNNDCWNDEIIPFSTNNNLSRSNQNAQAAASFVERMSKNEER